MQGSQPVEVLNVFLTIKCQAQLCRCSWSHWQVQCHLSELRAKRLGLGHMNPAVGVLPFGGQSEVVAEEREEQVHIPDLVAFKQAWHQGRKGCLRSLTKQYHLAIRKSFASNCILFLHFPPSFAMAAKLSAVGPRVCAGTSLL